MAFKTFGNQARKYLIHGQTGVAACEFPGVDSVRTPVFVRYALVGVLATSCHYVVLVTLVELVGATAAPAAAVGAICGALAGYAGNRRFTFFSDAPHGQALPRFILVSALGAITNGSIVWTGTELLRMHYLVAQLIATALILGLGFALNRRWTFA